MGESRRHRARVRAGDGQARCRRNLARRPLAVRLAHRESRGTAQAGHLEGPPARAGAAGAAAAEGGRAVHRFREADEGSGLCRVQGIATDEKGRPRGRWMTLRLHRALFVRTVKWRSAWDGPAPTAEKATKRRAFCERFSLRCNIEM